MTADRQEQIAVVGLAIVGLIVLAAHPRKTWRLLRQNVGWYS